MPDTAHLLQAYDDHLRTEAPSAIAVTRHGPLRLVTFPGGRGWVTYRDLGGADAPAVRQLVVDALDHYRADPGIERVKWKTRGHDHAPGLHDALTEHGFAEGETESIMIGEAAGLIADVALPAGVTARRVVDEPDVRAMCATASAVFADDAPDRIADALLRRLALSDGTELWIAEAGGRIVGTGRLEPVAGSRFAGIWGGATLPEWRGRGIYRALTAVRARSALAQGKTLIHSDSTDHSRPILERAGLVRVSSTTPYTWRRRVQSTGRYVASS
ncbi:GNAT family N-acetyltransferase [Pseudonocardia kunmingensis]|uniref:Acetyltransferase (GNAT) family protein n=1 Tax=Pseudonocardia kunmingensis TaxID=630975 RepID=A0A543DN73_9PSEU|nr:GNAT family N-acetyltransferase [Pseudonocardia kunmingensis]TQM10784.1 acetyltransferase (GNAT) family protein [Pseudonocardia kunmingensis]